MAPSAALGAELIATALVNAAAAAPPGLAQTAALSDLAWAVHRGMRHYAPTPLLDLQHLAGQLGVGAIWLKDESHRFGLNAFKGLGPSFAMHHLLATEQIEPDAVFTTATDGNHGRAVTWMARQLGMRAVVWMPTHSARARVDAVMREGADVRLVDEGYDAAVDRALEAGERLGWIVVQDTDRPGYATMPSWIGAGYWTMARELEATLHSIDQSGVDLVLLQAGVGTWPAAMVKYYWNRYGTRRPQLVIVEPLAAACVLESVIAGHPVRASGSFRTIMAGLNCGTPSLAAFDVLRTGADAFIAIDDAWAERAMRALAEHGVTSGESGSAGLAGLMALLADSRYAEVRHHLGLDTSRRILVWSTEGATDSEGWCRVVNTALPTDEECSE